MPVASLANVSKTPEEISAHETAMIALADAQKVAPPAATVVAPVVPATRPEWCPEKFWDAKTGAVNNEALAKSYRELETNRSTAKTPEQIAAEKATADAAAAQAVLDAAKTPEQLATEKAAKDAAAAAAPKLDFATVKSAAEAEFANTGKLSDQTYSLLEKNHGLSKGMVDQYISGAQAQSAAATNAIYAGAGTDSETVKQATAWAVESLSEAEKASFNNSLGTNDSAILAVKNLVSRFKAEATIEPGVTIHGAGTTSGGHYTSGADMKADMKSPKYKTDPAFRAEVAGKVDRATRAGIELFN